MRLSKEFFYTLRENASDEDSVSGNLLVRGGFITKISNGIYAKLPLGVKLTENIKEIVYIYELLEKSWLVKNFKELNIEPVLEL